MTPPIRIFLALCIAFLAASAQARPVYAVSCVDLDGAAVYSDEPTPAFLGFLGNATATDSIMNLNGPHGSTTGEFSVRNPDSKYGKWVSHFGIINIYAIHPPLIFRDGVIIGRLTSSIYWPDRVSLNYIDTTCPFASGTWGTGGPVPGAPIWLTASDGTFSDKVAVRWGAATGAAKYILTMAKSKTEPPFFFRETTFTGMDIVNLEPDHAYYFGVMATNANGPGPYVYDYGHVALPPDGTPVVTPVFTPAGTPVDAAGSTPETTPDGTLTTTPTPTPTSTSTPIPGETPSPSGSATPQTGDPTGTPFVYLPITHK